MEWPNDRVWGALNEEWFKIFDCGDLVLPTGRLLACDPNVYLGSSDLNLGCRVNISPGRYPIKLTVEREGNSDVWRVWYASLILSSEPEVIRKHICCVPSAEGGVSYLSDGVTREGVVEHFKGFPVETGTACLVDEGALADRIVPHFLRSKSVNPGGALSTPLSLQEDGANIITFSSGMGDGSYPLVAGLDAEGRMTVIHVDFLGPAEPDDADELSETLEQPDAE